MPRTNKVQAGDSTFHCMLSHSLLPPDRKLWLKSRLIHDRMAFCKILSSDAHQRKWHQRQCEVSETARQEHLSIFFFKILCIYLFARERALAGERGDRERQAEGETGSGMSKEPYRT